MDEVFPTTTTSWGECEGTGGWLHAGTRKNCGAAQQRVGTKSKRGRRGEELLWYGWPFRAQPCDDSTDAGGWDREQEEITRSAQEAI
jgi:hypothetical protein